MQKTLEVFDLVAPDVADSYSSSELTSAVELAETRLSSGVWGDRYRLALVYLAAHMLEIGGREGSGTGPITSEKAGKVSRSYGFSGGGDAGGLGSTEYGKQFVQLRDEVALTAPLTVYGNYG